MVWEEGGNGHGEKKLWFLMERAVRAGVELTRRCNGRITTPVVQERKRNEVNRNKRCDNGESNA